MREKENAQEQKKSTSNQWHAQGKWDLLVALVVLIKYKAQLKVLFHFQPKFKWFGDLQIHESKNEKTESKCKWVQPQ